MRKNILLSLFCLSGLQSFNLINASLASKFTKLNPTRLFNNAAKKQLMRNVCNKPESENPISNALWGMGGGFVGGAFGWGIGSTIDDLAGGSVNNAPGTIVSVAGASSVSYLVGGKVGLHSVLVLGGSIALLKAYRSYCKK